MTELSSDPGSFRDPRGRVYYHDGRVFRTILGSAVDDFEFVRSTGLIVELVEKGLAIASDVVDPDILGSRASGASYVVEHTKLAFVSYPYEWSFSALRAAALLHLEVQRRALEHDVTLADATAYNVQFEGPSPLFIDLLSFRRYEKGELWVGHRQFCEQFLAPLLLRSILGVPHNAWYRGNQEGINVNEINRLLPLRRKLSWNMFTNIVLQTRFQAKATNEDMAKDFASLKSVKFPRPAFRNLMNRLTRWIEGLRPADATKTVWADYAKSHSYESSEVAAKKAFVAEFVATVKPRMLWDFGCNTGDYSKVALEAGAGTVIGFDFDQDALDLAFARAESEKLMFLPLFLDAANPSPDQGWAQLERQGLRKRARADAFLALAFGHHLAIARNIPLDHLVDWYADMAPAGLIEFVPKADPMVRRLLSLREDIFSEYSESNFVSLLRSRANVIKSTVVSENGRKLFWFARE